ncbi:MAG: response regulator transcription factor [Bacteroidia bacterium]|nr:response regulator transcription factor [Bacteroidia bacterium]
MEHIRVMAFDDHPAIRQMLQVLIGSQEDMLCVGVHPDCRDLVRHIEAGAPQVVVMDISMPGMDGIEAVRQIRSRFPAVRVLMQTVFEDQDRIFEAIYAGASGYILKKSSTGEIVEAIRNVFRGGSPMTPSVAAKVLDKFRGQAPATALPPEDYQLSARERETLSYLVEGLSYKMIADKMHISFHTVDAHIRKIYEKLHVRSMAEAVSKAIRKGLV